MPEARVLILYVEPTPYLLRLITLLSHRWPAEVDVLFMKENVSQAWALSLDHARMSLLPDSLPAALRVLGSRLASGQYGLVHLAGWAPTLMPAAMLLARLHGIPVAVESDTPLPAGLPKWKRLLKRLLYPLLFSLPSRFLPGGSRQANYLRAYGVGEPRITIANMTVDVAEIMRHVDAIGPARRGELRQALGLGQQSTVYLYVGRMEPHKGLHDLIEAFKVLPIDVPNPPALLLVGDGSMRDHLKETVKKNPRIFWPGRLTDAALLEAYAVADVFVLPSRFEPWGLVVNEAMAAGLPVIATDQVGCVDDLVVHGQTGLVVRSASPDALRKAMETLLRDVTIRDRMSRHARSLIAGWTLEDEAEILTNTWKQLLKH